jgi:hypothetical protein
MTFHRGAARALTPAIAARGRIWDDRRYLDMTADRKEVRPTKQAA